MDKREFMVNRVPLYRGRGVEVRIVVPSRVERQAYYLELPSMRPVAEGDVVPAALSLSDDEAQQLCDSLWEAGVRPTNGEGSTGQLAATREHLEDMRTLAFHALRIPEAVRVDGIG